MIKGQPKVASTNGIHVTNRPRALDEGNPYYVQVMNLFNKDFRLRQGMVTANITPFKGPLTQAKPGELKSLVAPLKVMEDAHAQVDIGEAPDALRDQLMGQVENYKSLWDGTLRLIKKYGSPCSPQA